MRELLALLRFFNHIHLLSVPLALALARTCLSPFPLLAAPLPPTTSLLIKVLNNIVNVRFNIDLAPTITSASTSTTKGQLVTIQGTNFGFDSSAVSVKINGRVCSNITITTPHTVSHLLFTDKHLILNIHSHAMLHQDPEHPTL